MKIKNLNELIYIFDWLIQNYNFNIKEISSENNFIIFEFQSENFNIKLEKYFREIYISIYKNNFDNSEINLFNLLDFFYQDVDYAPKAKYFKDLKDLNECYLQQLTYISHVLKENFELVLKFYKNSNYNLNELEFKKYWMKKHPELYLSE